jgi:hypothetical protein
VGLGKDLMNNLGWRNIVGSLILIMGGPTLIVVIQSNALHLCKLFAEIS